MTPDQESRRFHLMRLMSQARLSSPQVAKMMDRSPATVRAWRCGAYPMPDHSLALFELLVRHGYHKKEVA